MWNNFFYSLKNSIKFIKTLSFTVYKIVKFYSTQLTLLSCSILGQRFSNFSACHNHLEGLLKHRMLIIRDINIILSKTDNCYRTEQHKQ